MHATPPTLTAIDPALCPLCGQANLCAMEQARASGTPATEPCWCTQIDFGADLLARVPEAARRVSCICAVCAQTAKAQP